MSGELTDETLQQIVSDYQQMEVDGMEEELEKTDWQIVNYLSEPLSRASVSVIIKR